MTKHLLTWLFISIVSFTNFAQVFETPEEATPLQVGEQIPNLIVQALDNSKKEIGSIIAEQPSIILFYRGGWCPYCNRHLSAVGEAKEEISQLGYQIIGISPDTPSKLKATIEKGKLDYKLYSDSDTKLIQAMGIAYRAPDRYTSKLASFSNDLNDDTIPVPSVYIVDTRGEIIFQYSDTNYKERLSTKKLINELKKLNKN